MSTASGDSRSLAIPAGGSVTSSTICFERDVRTLRFFAASSGESSTASLEVDARYEDAAGNLRSVRIGSHPAGDWTPTAPMRIVVSRLPLLPGDHTLVQFRFRPQGSASWQIDDVYVDPRRH